MVPGVHRQVEYLDIEVPPDPRPAGGTIPGAEQIDRHAVAARGAGQLVKLDPVEALGLGIGDGDEALGIEGVPPGPMGVQQAGKVRGTIFLHRGDRFRGGGVAREGVGDAEHDPPALVGGRLAPGRGESAARETRLLADRDALDGLLARRGVGLAGGIMVRAVDRGPGLPGEPGAVFPARGFDVRDERHLPGVDDAAEAEGSLVGPDLAADFGVPEIEPQPAALDGTGRRQHQAADRQAGVVAAMLGDVRAAPSPSGNGGRRRGRSWRPSGRCPGTRRRRTAPATSPRSHPRARGSSPSPRAGPPQPLPWMGKLPLRRSSPAVRG